MWKDNDNEKGPLRFRPLPKEDGCRFYGHKPFGVKATVGKVINMMNLSFLSPKTIACIARGAVSLEQHYYYHSWGWSNHYCVRVTYPNGLGASIVCEPKLSNGETDIWEVALLKDNELYVDADGMDYIESNLTEEDVIHLCDHIYFIE